MEVITLQSKVWEALQESMAEIHRQIKEDSRKQWEEEWIDNEAFLVRLKISRKTAQTYRDSGLIPFSQIGNKIYYRNRDIEAFLICHRIERKR